MPCHFPKGLVLLMQIYANCVIINFSKIVYMMQAYVSNV